MHCLAYEGLRSKNPLAFKHYGETIREHLRFAHGVSMSCNDGVFG